MVLHNVVISLEKNVLARHILGYKESTARE